jgi:hypothetical protein
VAGVAALFIDVHPRRNNHFLLELVKAYTRNTKLQH